MDRKKHIPTQSSAATLLILEGIVEHVSGCKVSELRERTLDQQRHYTERAHGRTVVFRKAFPTIGRGNIMRERTKSRDEIEHLLDEVLG